MHLNIYVYICRYVNICVSIYFNVYIYADVYINMYLYMYTYIYIHIHLYTATTRLARRTVTSLHRDFRWMSLDLLQKSSGCFYPTCNPQRTSWNVWFRLKLSHQHAFQHLRTEAHTVSEQNKQLWPREPRSALKFPISRPGFLRYVLHMGVCINGGNPKSLTLKRRPL